MSSSWLATRPDVVEVVQGAAGAVEALGVDPLTLGPLADGRGLEATAEDAGGFGRADVGGALGDAPGVQGRHSSR